MFGLSLGETAVILLVALVVIGPKELPKVIKVVMQFVGYVKDIAADFKAQIEEVTKESGLNEIRKELEADEVFTQMPTIIDLEGKPQPVFDIADDLAAREKKRAEAHIPQQVQPVELEAAEEPKHEAHEAAAKQEGEKAQ